MKEQYNIDLEKYSLQRFQASLRKRDLIPSRVILKEGIEEKFEILSDNGIENLKSLIGELKTKQKIELFSKKSGLSIDYLTILKREASSYIPNPVRLKDFPGIDSEVIKALEEMGIKNTKHLFKTVKIKGKIDELSQSTTISLEKLNELASLSDLARLYGVGPVFARIIYDVGINSVETFSRYKAEDFIRIYESKTQKRADFGVNDIAFTLELAKELGSL